MKQQLLFRMCLASFMAFAPFFVSVHGCVMDNMSDIEQEDGPKAETVYFINESFRVYNNLKSTGFEVADKYIANLVFGETDVNLDQAYGNSTCTVEKCPVSLPSDSQFDAQPSTPSFLR